MKIAIGSDHAGYEMKEKVKRYLQEKGFGILDFGTNTAESVDYPDFIHPVANIVSRKEVDFGFIFCGSGNGASITANKHQEIRSALCWIPEIARLARLHNNANICSIPARFIDEQTMYEIVEVFLSTPFEGGRHNKRIDKIPVK